jgi:hypothetical protein
VFRAKFLHRRGRVVDGFNATGIGIQDDPISMGRDVHSVCKRCAWRSCRVGSTSRVFTQQKK